MSLVSINDVLKITTRVEKIHPYKVVGDRDSYSPYNEGWSDCVSLIESYLEKLPSAESERMEKIHDDKIHPVIHHCGKDIVTLINPIWNYCPCCGKKFEWI